MAEIHSSDGLDTSSESNADNTEKSSLSSPENAEEQDARDKKTQDIEANIDTENSSEKKDVKSPSELAEQDQRESDSYNMDDWSDTKIEAGTKLYQLSPADESNYYTTEEDVAARDYNSRKINDGLQIAPFKDKPQRTEMTVYEVKQDTPAAEAICSANTDYGDGGMKQYYIPDSKTSGNMEKVETIQLEDNNEDDD